MANLKISELDAAAALDGTEKIPAVQGVANVALTPAQLKTFFGTYVDYVPVFTGFSIDPVVAQARFCQIGKMVHVTVLMSTGTSNATGFTMSLPVAAKSGQTQHGVTVGNITNNSAQLTSPGRISTVAGAATLNIYRDTTGLAWTASGTKGVNINFTYEAN